MYIKTTRFSLILIMGINLNAVNLKSQTLKADFTFKTQCHIASFYNASIGNPDYYILEMESTRIRFDFWGNFGHYYGDGNRSAKLIVYRSDTVNGIVTLQSDSITKSFNINCDSCIDAKLDLQFDSTKPFFAAIYNYTSGRVTDHDWDFGDNEYSEEKEPIHFYNNSGQYLIVYRAFDSVNLCDDTAQLRINIDSFGGLKRSAFKIQIIDKMNPNSGLPSKSKINDWIKVYPNPSNEKVFIQSENDFKLLVTDITGKVITDTENLQEVNLPKGVYLFRFLVNRYVIVERVIVW